MIKQRKKRKKRKKKERKEKKEKKKTGMGGGGSKKPTKFVLVGDSNVGKSSLVVVLRYGGVLFENEDKLRYYDVSHRVEVEGVSTVIWGLYIIL